VFSSDLYLAAGRNIDAGAGVHVESIGIETVDINRTERKATLRNALGGECLQGAQGESKKQKREWTKEKVRAVKRKKPVMR
jgi:hypothetical protein